LVGDAAENVSEPSLRIDAIELGGFDQGIGDGGRLCAAQGTYEEINFSARSNRVKKFDRRIINKDGLSVQNMPPDGIGQRL